MGFPHMGHFVARIAHGLLGLILADLVVGLTAFSSIVLGGLWIFSAGWIHLVAEYRSAGLTFGAPWQLDLAWVGGIICLPLIVLVVVLGFRSLQLPLGVIRRARTPPAPLPQ